jgi:hypothetical protein
LFLNPEYNIVDNGGLLKAIAGSGYARPPSPMATPKLPAESRGQSEWKQVAKESRDKKNLQNAFSEILQTREKLGKQFLPETQLMQILTKHVPMSTAQKVADDIASERKRFEPKYRSVTTTDPLTKKTTSRLVDEETLKGEGITSGGLSRIEQIKDDIASGKRNLTDLSAGERFAIGLSKPSKAPELKKMKNPQGQFTWHQWDGESWADTGKGAYTTSREEPQDNQQAIDSLFKTKVDYKEKTGMELPYNSQKEFLNAWGVDPKNWKNILGPEPKGGDREALLREEYKANTRLINSFKEDEVAIRSGAAQDTDLDAGLEGKRNALLAISLIKKPREKLEKRQAEIMRELEGKPLKEKTEKDAISTQIRILRNKKTGETVVVDADGNVLERRNAQGGEIIGEKIR